MHRNALSTMLIACFIIVNALNFRKSFCGLHLLKKSFSFVSLVFMARTIDDTPATPQKLREIAAQLRYISDRYLSIAREMDEIKAASLSGASIKTVDRSIGYLKNTLSTARRALESELLELAVAEIESSPPDIQADAVRESAIRVGATQAPKAKPPTKRNPVQ